ncbi:stalk domain-containing protein [Thermovenabulum gondwanense]|uniref:Putative sporulation-specific glycosylase YdhD n=1 Tax=Thermovenabulum gondwanense TaxID=520767 RepID=A0A162MWH2_9FIRM|nr:stalk domain-containing protein [Thermovenabulum gondwanense]KYO68017.1 putative sporulation-specific glycosylase YdhD [Thermovenabulum gondwanense]
MKKTMGKFKYILTTLIILIFCFSTYTPSYAATASVILDGSLLKFDVNPILKNNRVFVPFRAISEKVGATVNWDNRERKVTAFNSEFTVELKLNSKVALVNNKTFTMDVSPILYQGRVLVPLRFFSEAFGATVNWDEKSRTVNIISKQKVLKHILGYYYSYSFQDFLNNADRLTSVAVKWYTLDDNARLTNYDNKRFIMTPQDYQEVFRIAKEKGIYVYALVFESDRQKLSQALATPEKRKEIVQSIVYEVQKEGYDGVNLDFEYLSPSDKDNFNEFVKSLYNALKEKNKSLNLSLPVKTEERDWWPGYDYETLGKYSDFVVLMAYDKNPANPEPQAGVDWVEQILDYTLKRIPAEKVVLGIGYYGYAWANGKKYTVLPSRMGFNYTGTLYADELQSKYGLKFNIDEKTLMAYGKFTDENNVTYQIWMESDVAVKNKVISAVSKGLKGVAVWRLGYTTNGFWDAVGEKMVPLKK